jgi:sulfatase maturation enzyme AslB (radical SAM superfamily)
MNIQNFPSRIVLELTPLCNLSCFMCPRHYIKETDGYMDIVLFKKLIDEISIENPKAIVLPFWRGESCLHPDFVGLVGYALDKNIRIHLSTNGHYMNKEFMDIFYRSEFVTFSIHTDLGYKNAKKLLENKPEWSKVVTQISFVDTEKSTIKYLQSCTTNEKLNGFNSVRLYVEHTIGGEFGKSRDEKAKEQRHFCPKLTHTLVVSSDGGFSRCNHIWEPENIPNLGNTTIKDIWNGARMNEIRAKYPDEKCGPCDQWGGHTNGENWKVADDGQVIHTVYGI